MRGAICIRYFIEDRMANNNDKRTLDRVNHPILLAERHPSDLFLDWPSISALVNPPERGGIPHTDEDALEFFAYLLPIAMSIRRGVPCEQLL
jgi:hypothetical protein